MESLLELQNEGNGLGLRIPGRLEELYGDRGGRFSLLGSRPLVSSLDPISSDPGVFSGFPECQAMNIRVLVVDDEPRRFAESSGGDERRGGTVALAIASNKRLESCLAFYEKALAIFQIAPFSTVRRRW